MPKVFGMHEIELQPGVEPEDYERFFAEELAPTLKRVQVAGGSPESPATSPGASLVRYSLAVHKASCRSRL